MKKYIETIFAKNFARTYEKKIILGTSDAWSTSHLSQQTSVLYCRLSDFWCSLAVESYIKNGDSGIFSPAQ